jgi:flagellar hook-basal body complex protein FliE
VPNPIGFGPRGLPPALEPSELRIHGGTGSSEPGGASFGDLLKRAINDASDMQGESKELISAFLRGEPVELHQVMAASEEAAISLEILVEIRNKLTDAYRTVMNIQ